jgi:hypothetical protein
MRIVSEHRNKTVGELLPRIISAAGEELPMG